MAIMDYFMLKESIDAGIHNLQNEILSNINLFSNGEYGLKAIKDSIDTSGTDISYKLYQKSFGIPANTGFTTDKVHYTLITDFGSDLTIDNLFFMLPKTSNYIPSLGSASGTRKNFWLLFGKIGDDGNPIFDGTQYTVLSILQGLYGGATAGTTPMIYIDFIRESDVTSHANFTADKLYNQKVNGSENINNPSFNDMFIYCDSIHSTIYQLRYNASESSRITYIHLIIPDNGLYIPEGYGLFYSQFYFSESILYQQLFSIIYH